MDEALRQLTMRGEEGINLESKQSIELLVLPSFFGLTFDAQLKYSNSK